jgi:diaminopropionate ammonia-lyase
MQIVLNPFRSKGGMPEVARTPSVDAQRAVALVARCPVYAATPLSGSAELAKLAGVAEVLIKDERERMGLGSFKALGAAYLIASDADATGAVDLTKALSGTTYVTASAGNHGLSVAAGARAFGARAVVYIADTVPEAFAARLRDTGADVVREGATYEDSMAAAANAADKNGWHLLSDSSWPGYFERPHRLMEGYLILMAEVFDQISAPPTHLFLQAGVGGLAGAAAALARQEWGDAVRIIVVEPEAAPALAASITAGAAVFAAGPVSVMGRLDCKEPSLIALQGLSRDADVFATLAESDALSGTASVAEAGLRSTPSGAAGLAALLCAVPHRAALGLDSNSRVLCILSEGPEA